MTATATAVDAPRPSRRHHARRVRRARVGETAQAAARPAGLGRRAALLRPGRRGWCSRRCTPSTDAATNPPSIAAGLTLDGYREFFGTSGASPWPPLINSHDREPHLDADRAAAWRSRRRTRCRSGRSRSGPTSCSSSCRPRCCPPSRACCRSTCSRRTTGLLDNIWLLVILYTSMNLPIAVWMMRSFLAEVPVEILEAASSTAPGCSACSGRIVMPAVAMPGIAATALICFIFSWNELLLRPGAHRRPSPDRARSS